MQDTYLELSDGIDVIVAPELLVYSGCGLTQIFIHFTSGMIRRLYPRYFLIVGIKINLGID